MAIDLVRGRPGAVRSAAKLRGGRSRRLALAALVALGLAGCAGARPGSAPVTSARSPSGTGGADAPWTLPADAYPTQILFRVEAETSDGGAAVRMVLRLQDPHRYRLTVSDRLGRTLYTVDVGPGGGWLADHRSREACPIAEAGGALVLRGAPLEGFSIAALPAVLLGRVPAEPAGEVTGRGSGEIALRDPQGRRWTMRLDGQTVLSWTLWEGQEPVLWWRRDGDRALLSDRLRGAQLRWQLVAREPLAEELPETAMPEGFAAVECPAAGTGPFDSPQGDL